MAFALGSRDAAIGSDCLQRQQLRTAQRHRREKEGEGKEQSGSYTMSNGSNIHSARARSDLAGASVKETLQQRAVMNIVKSLMAKTKKFDERRVYLIAENEVQEAIRAKKMHSVQQIQDLENRCYQLALV